MTVLIKKIKPTSEMNDSETKPGPDRSRINDNRQVKSSTLSK